MLTSDKYQTPSYSFAPVAKLNPLNNPAVTSSPTSLIIACAGSILLKISASVTASPNSFPKIR